MICTLILTKLSIKIGDGTRDHLFETSSGEGVKNWSNLPTDSIKKLSTEGGRGQK